MTTDIEKLRGLLSGSGERWACHHPDVEHLAIDHCDRVCVLDNGAASDCDIALFEHYEAKEACPMWKAGLRVAPEPLTIEQAADLLTELEALRARCEGLEAALGKIANMRFVAAGGSIAECRLIAARALSQATGEGK